MQRSSERALEVEPRRSAKCENTERFLQQGDDAEEDEAGDEEGADGIGDVQAQVFDQQSGEDDADGAESVRKYVQEDTLHVRVLRVLRIVRAAVAVRVTVGPVRVAVGSVGMAMRTVRVTVGPAAVTVGPAAVTMRVSECADTDEVD